MGVRLKENSSQNISKLHMKHRTDFSLFPNLFDAIFVSKYDVTENFVLLLCLKSSFKVRLHTAINQAISCLSACYIRTKVTKYIRVKMTL